MIIAVYPSVKTGEISVSIVFIDFQSYLWISAIKRDEGPTFKITSNTVVCGAHFAQQDFFPSLDIVSTCDRPKPRRLRSDTLPSAFPFRSEKVYRPSPQERRKVADLRFVKALGQAFEIRPFNKGWNSAEGADRS